MKLALIRRQFAATGGAELYLQRLLRTLLKQGREAHLFAEARQALISCGTNTKMAGFQLESHVYSKKLVGHSNQDHRRMMTSYGSR